MANGKSLPICRASLKIMSYSVRKATLKDLPVLLDFEQRLIKVERPMNPTIKDGHINYYDISAFITGDDADVFVVESNNEIVASGYAKIKNDIHYLKHEKKGHLGFMFVPEEHRGKGYNKLIIEALLKWCKERGIFEVKLDVYEENPSAIRAYEKMGFKKHLINMRLNIASPEL